MSWLLPSALAMAGVAVLSVVALHFISRRRPLAEPFPTVRFVPRRPVHARVRAIEFSDILLLIIRILAITAIGLGVAGPLFHTGRGRVRRVVVVDRSRAVGNPREAADSARALLREGDALVVFDSAARIVAGARALDSLSPVPIAGSLSAALAAGIRAGARLSEAADSVELTLVSPVAQEELDDATIRIRSAWPGPMRVVAVGAATAPIASAPVEFAGSSDDPVTAGFALMNPRSAAIVRLARGHLTAADTAWASERGHVLVHWPAFDSLTVWPKRTTIDAIGGVASAGGVLVGRLPRLWSLNGKAVARWADGEPAAVEHVVGDGCIRDVAVIVDPASDLTLHQAFRDFARPLIEPCGGMARLAPIDAATLSVLGGKGTLASASQLRDRSSESSRWTPWLLLLGAILLFVELPMRRTKAQLA